jgi:peptidoglycan/xylan/chitin deacetylase (PgdA/CDA1 family)
MSGALAAAPTIFGMTGFPIVVTALALLLGSIEPAPQPGPAAVGPARAPVPVPILMYHVIGDPPPGTPWPQLYVSAAEFAAQVDWLDRNGFEPVTLSAAWRAWHGGQALPPRPVVLTFDDGHRSIVTKALPLLRARGWPGVLNLKLGNLEPGSFTAAHVRTLVAAGWELGAHTFTHPDLRSLGAVELEREVAGSRAEIARRFGVRVNFFCYPAGRYDARVVAAVRNAGFLGATTTIEGLATPARPFELKRVRVSRGDGVSGLATSLPARTEASRGSAPPGRASGSRG